METRVRSRQVIRSISFRSKARHSQNTELYSQGQSHDICQSQSQNLSINSSLQPLSHKSQKSRDWIKESHIFGRVFLLLFDYLHSRDKEYSHQFSHVNYFLIIPNWNIEKDPKFSVVIRLPEGKQGKGCFKQFSLGTTMRILHKRQSQKPGKAAVRICCD